MQIGKNVVQVKPTDHAVEVFTADYLAFAHRLQTVDQTRIARLPLSCCRKAEQVQSVESAIVAASQEVRPEAAHDTDCKELIDCVVLSRNRDKADDHSEDTQEEEEAS